jgi:sugar transferase EpsL
MSSSRGFYWRGGKRALDLTTVCLGLIGAAPVMGLIALVLLVTQGRPVLFRQSRPGLRGRRFGILKFRTMRDEADTEGRALPDARRLTPVGRLLRRTSLDELPELLNVLKGDMSLVGPRPLLVRYLDRYTPQQARRHEVRPGITGWAQVNGRNALTWEDKFQLDVWYVDNLSFALDLRILLKTIGKVLRGEGVAAEGFATMPEFMGSRESGRQAGKEPT